MINPLLAFSPLVANMATDIVIGFTVAQLRGAVRHARLLQVHLQSITQKLPALSEKLCLGISSEGLTWTHYILFGWTDFKVMSNGCVQDIIQEDI